MSSTSKYSHVSLSKDDLSSKYTTTDLAKKALSDLTSALNLDADLDTRNLYGIMSDRGAIQDVLENATRAAYEQQAREALASYDMAEDTMYTNNRDTIGKMRGQLAGDSLRGANVGAANATALQAILGLGAQNAASTTEGLRNLYGVQDKKTAALAQNAADALTQSNAAKAQEGGIATSRYASDSERAAYAAEAMGALASALDTNAANERMNSATNKTNKAVSQTQTYSTVYNKK